MNLDAHIHAMNITYGSKGFGFMGSQGSASHDSYGQGPYGQGNGDQGKNGKGLIGYNKFEQGSGQGTESFHDHSEYVFIHNGQATKSFNMSRDQGTESFLHGSKGAESFFNGGKDDDPFWNGGQATESMIMSLIIQKFQKLNMNIDHHINIIQ